MSAVEFETFVYNSGIVEIIQCILEILPNEIELSALFGSNPALLELISETDQNVLNKLIYANMHPIAINLFKNQQKEPNYYWLGKNPNPEVFDLIQSEFESLCLKKNKENGIWLSQLCHNPNPQVVKLIMDLIPKWPKRYLLYSLHKYPRSPYNIHLGYLACNPSAAEAIINCGLLDSKDKLSNLLWRAFSSNPHPLAIKYLQQNINKIHIDGLCTNPNPDALHLLIKNYTPDNWNFARLSTNPAAIGLLKNNYHKIAWGYFTENPHPEALLMLISHYKNKLHKINFTRMIKKNYWNPYYHAYIRRGKLSVDKIRMILQIKQSVKISLIPTGKSVAGFITNVDNIWQPQWKDTAM